METASLKQGLHLEPPTGWLNDPNGLCRFKGLWHVFFQYSPESADGRSPRMWGHYVSSDMRKWQFAGTPLKPDIPEDRDGVYSGCAVVENETMHIFYTGNVKEPGDHDYVLSGRGANVIHVTSDDGFEMSPKKVELRNSDYPDYCSCHVRDPKVWFENNLWHMVLGARTRDDRGIVLLYHAESLNDGQWIFDKKLDTIDGSTFGYMWECPDIFEDTHHNKYLSFSPQGLPHEEFKNQNVFQSGYAPIIDGAVDTSKFREWDMGFDFYAPQTFDTGDGRRILYGWMGIGDCDYVNPTVKYGRQHCLTLPREVFENGDHIFHQLPARELLPLDRCPLYINNNSFNARPLLPFKLEAKVDKSFSINIDNGLCFSYDSSNKQAVLEFKSEVSESASASNDNSSCSGSGYIDSIGQGRTIRKALISSCSNIIVIADYTSIEIYLNNGEMVFSSRYYPSGKVVDLSCENIIGSICMVKAEEVTDIE